MNRFLIRYDNEKTLKSLEKLGEITYKSNIINLIFINTSLSKDELLDIEGVEQVTKERIGKFI